MFFSLHKYQRVIFVTLMGLLQFVLREIVCPTNTHVVIVQCYVQEIISNERIGQLLIQGPCNIIEPYIYFCFDNKIFGKL